jgi:hypothetical protein
MRWRHSPPAALAVELEEEAEGRQQPLCSRLHFLHTNTHTRAPRNRWGETLPANPCDVEPEKGSQIQLARYLRVTCVQSSGCVVV